MNMIEPRSKEDFIMPQFPPGCPQCEHLTYEGYPSPNEDRVLSGETVWTCAAFPDGIPASVVLHETDHTKEYPGDKGLRYKPYVHKGGDTKVGYTIDWHGTIRDAETGKEIQYYSEIR
jgi:hypothetical protein